MISHVTSPMKNLNEKQRQPIASQLRALLTLARELFQDDDSTSSLGLVGRTLAELLQPETALLLLRNDRLELVGFDRAGRAHAAGADHPLYGAGMARLSLVAGAAGAGAGVGGERHSAQAGTRMLVLAVPAHAALAVLVAAWDHDLDGPAQDAHTRAMSSVLTLAAAALGKIETRSALEQLVRHQRDHIASSAAAHAAELARRDLATSEVRLLSLTDVLTGLYNRRGFFVQAELVYKLARRKRGRSAVIFADIDGLKRVNDTLGHEMGDQLIRDTANVFRQSFRRADVISRLGGDEFVAYTLDDERPGVILERIAANLHAFNLMQERPYTVSVSAGLVECDPADDKTLADYVLLADERMYAAKRSRLH